MTRNAILDTSDALSRSNSTCDHLTCVKSMATLPTWFLINIFKHLSRSELVRAALVCKAWSTPALELVWASFKFVREREFERIFAIMTRHTASRPYGSYVKSIDLTHADREFYMSPNIILLVTSICSNLESISITFHHTRPVAPPVPPPIMQNHHRPVLPPIKRLGDTTSPPSRSPSQQIPPLPRHALQPPVSTSPSSPSVPAASRYNHSLPLAHFAYNCPKLRSIRLVSYSPKSDDSVYEMAKYMRSGALDTVIFTGCATLQGSTLCKLVMTNPQLRHIEIMGNTPVSDSSLATIADRCGSNLERLSIGNASQLSDKSMRYVAKRCSNLRQIVIFNNPDGDQMTEYILTEIIASCTKLQSISLSNARSLGDTFFRTVVRRVEEELVTIEHGKMDPQSGLQRLCFGGIRREVIQSPNVVRLIKMSASESGEVSDDQQENWDWQAPSSENGISSNPAYMPKVTVIRGSSIWWQRRRGKVHTTRAS
ncbi:uncharacterized protein BYT42DRAFT_577565 [Radiomyces spectabilis]|uniref:uncharacterized protein n=1 Tax=Radiomyces spectabilis TaxID=64574 RepID=UPI00221FCB5C|nr:uncharacterized protein BYT42DRAFT_577565 [Radiomyces spectabilis]KAI8374759.1 hypothetical protein BYT42DRAFT_577565 [Radiomyces spectabilis]